MTEVHVLEVTNHNIFESSTKFWLFRTRPTKSEIEETLYIDMEETQLTDLYDLGEIGIGNITIKLYQKKLELGV